MFDSRQLLNRSHHHTSPTHAVLLLWIYLFFLKVFFSFLSESKGEAAAMNTQQMEQMGQFRITVWEEENFQGKRCEFMLECQNIMERGFNKIRSIKVENGP